jgi:hypothetical protein
MTLHRRVLVCATDAGGARNLGPVVATFRDEADFLVFGSPVTRPIFAEYGVVSTDLVLPDLDSAVGWLGERHPDIVLCGRTRYVSTDRRLAGAARHWNIPSVVMLDEWYLYEETFRDETGGTRYLTDWIFCPDALAQREAIAEGLPADRMVITGSPALAALADRITRFSVDPPAAPVLLPDDRPVILWISETFADDHGDSPGRRGKLGSWLGYTELTVRQALMQGVADFGQPVRVIEKLHPITTPENWPPPAAPGFDWSVVQQVPLWPLLWNCDLVIGMRSMALMEAALMGLPTLSFQPGMVGAQGCTAVRLGLVDFTESPAGLAAWLTRHWPARPRVTTGRTPVCPGFAAPDAADNVWAQLRAAGLARSPLPGLCPGPTKGRGPLETIL